MSKINVIVLVLEKFEENICLEEVYLFCNMIEIESMRSGRKR